MKRVKNRADVESAEERVKLTGPGFSSMSPERKRKARRREQRGQRVRGRVNSRQKGDGMWVRCEYWRQAVR